MNLLLETALFVRNNPSLLTHLEKLIFIIIATRIGQNDYSWVSIEQLAKDCNLKKRKIIYLLKSLSDKELIKVEKVGRCNRYFISTEKVHHSAPINNYTDKQQVHDGAPIQSEKVHGCAPIEVTNRCMAVHLSSEKNVEISDNNQGLANVSPLPKYNNKIKQNKHIKAKETQKHMLPASKFDNFWSLYPRKENRKKAFEIWTRKKLDDIADKILIDVQNRSKNHHSWKQGFIPHATTYLNGERWEDEIRYSPFVHKPMSTMEYLQAIWAD